MTLFKFDQNMIHHLYRFFLTILPKKKKTKFYKSLNWHLHNYLQSNLVRYYKTISRDSLGVDATSNVIVSLTTFPARIKIVDLSIRSILNQTKKPQKVVLWLGKEKFPEGKNNLPNSLLELTSCGLEIEFCQDIGAHTKYYHVFKKYPKNIIVTVDDDIIYPNNLLEILINSHQKYPDCVIANRVRYMGNNASGLKPYRKWKINKRFNDNPSYRLFATGVSGVLYQPAHFKESLFDKDSILRIKCLGDDVWLKAAQIVSEIPVVFTNFYFKKFMEIPESQKISLFRKNVIENDNDRQIKEVFDYFGIVEDSFI